MKLFTRYLTRVLIFLIGLSLLVMLSGWYVMNTARGTRFFFHQLPKLLPDHLQINAVTGTLATGVDLQGIQYYSPDVTLKINQAAIAIAPADLLHGVLNILQLQVNEMQVKLPTAKKTTMAKTSLSDQFAFLRRVKFNDITMSHVSIEQNNLKHDFQEILLTKQGLDYKLTIAADELNATLVVNNENAILQNKLIVKWDAQATDLSLIDPNLHGNVKSDGELSMQNNAVNVNASLTGMDITYGNYRIDKLDMDLNSAGQSITSTVAIKQIKFNDINIPTAQLSVKSNINKQFVFASLHIPDATIPASGSHLKNITLHGDYQNLHHLQFNGTFYTGEGNGHVTGQFDGNQLNLQLSGKNLETINLPEYQVNTNPNIHINYALNEGIQLSGKVEVVNANINPTDLTQTVKPSSDIVYKNAEEETNSIDLSQLALDVAITLNNPAKINYNKLQTELTGQLQISKAPNGVAQASGELETKNGKYQIYGDTLDIETGKIIYTGNLLTDPALEIRAIKKIQKVQMNSNNRVVFNNELKNTYSGTGELIVGVLITGTVNHPVIKLISEPAGLNQADILSYLLFGHPKDKINSTTSLTMLNSILSTGTGSVNFTKKIQQTLNLSELNVGQTEFYNASTNATDTQTTLSIGKQLGDRFYVRYSVGLFQSVSMLNLRYQITKNLSLQSQRTSTTETGVDNGVDLLYEYATD